MIINAITPIFINISEILKTGKSIKLILKKSLTYP